MATRGIFSDIPRMNCFSMIPLTIPAAIICSCSGVLPGVGILAPASVAGYRMDFSDLEGTHEYRFAADGTYTEKCTPADVSQATTEAGEWKWTRSSPSDATLTLDENKIVNLKFTTDDHANGTFSGQKRLYAFEFTEM